MKWEDKNFSASHNLLIHPEKHYTNCGNGLALSSHRNFLLAGQDGCSRNADDREPGAYYLVDKPPRLQILELSICRALLDTSLLQLSDRTDLATKLSTGRLKCSIRDLQILRYCHRWL